MRRTLLFLLVLSGTFLLTACLTIEDRTELNADGSGIQTTIVDFGSLFDNPMVKMGMQEELRKSGKTEMLERVDSTFRLTDQLGALNPQWTAAERALVERAHGEVVMDFEDGEGYVKTMFPFDRPEQIDELAAILAKSNKPEGQQGNPFEGLSGSQFFDLTRTLKGKKLSWKATKSADFENPLAAAGLDEDTMGMMQSMFGDAVVNYTIVFPGKIKKVKGFPGHEIDESTNTMTLLFDFIEIIENPEVIARALNGEVKFRK